MLLRQLLNYTSETGYNYSQGGGTYPNFFDAHPPFQIDGNFGGTAGITEMLLQSQLNEIYLLPALPNVWKEGTIKGLKARGNYEVSIAWKNHKLTNASITAFADGICKVRSAAPVKIKGMNVKAVADEHGYVISFNVKKDRTYDVYTD